MTKARERTSPENPLKFNGTRMERVGPDETIYHIKHLTLTVDIWNRVVMLVILELRKRFMIPGYRDDDIES
jgi:hypothetical protein